MNDVTLTQLKILVERAVRPVRASSGQKRKVREELLAHVSAVFEEEQAALGEERAALRRTEQRFGHPGELTEQLQGSVRARDALDRFLDWTWFPSVRRYTCWNALILLVFLPVWYLWVLGCRWAATAVAWPAEEERLFGGPVLLLDVLFFAFSFGILVWGLVKIEREMAARIRSDREWTSLSLEVGEGTVP